MNEPITIEGCDALLWPFLQATDPAIAERFLAGSPPFTETRVVWSVMRSASFASY